MRVLVVEDEAAVRERLKTHLECSGFGVDVARDGEEGLYAGLNYPLDAAIVDIGLPVRSGLEIIRRWRLKNRRFPVVIVSARVGWQCRVEGLQAGADDYVEKPFSYEEVVTRIRCVVRRAHGWIEPAIVCGAFVLDTQKQTVSVDGKPIGLTTFEFRLLEALMLNAGKVLSGSALAERLYDEEMERDSNVIQHFISRLRRKLAPFGRRRAIETVYGGGYRFAIERGRPE